MVKGRVVVPASTVLDVLPSFSNISCLVHLYVDMDQFLRDSILDELVLIKVFDSLVGLTGTDDSSFSDDGTDRDNEQLFLVSLFELTTAPA